MSDPVVLHFIQFYFSVPKSVPLNVTNQRVLLVRLDWSKVCLTLFLRKPPFV